MLPTLYASRPPSFRHFLNDSLLASGLPYGPQAREHLARAYPDLFGNAYGLTLRGYERWLARRGAGDSPDAFAGYMDGRYRRWAAAAARD